MVYVENRHGLGVNNSKSLVNEVDKSKDAIQKSLDETQILYDSLMQKYFG